MEFVFLGERGAKIFFVPRMLGLGVGINICVDISKNPMSGINLSHSLTSF